MKSERRSRTGSLADLLDLSSGCTDGCAFPLDGLDLEPALVATVRRAREHRARVAVVVPSGTVRKVLGEASLDLVVSLSETIELALAEIQDDASTPNRIHTLR